MEGRFEFEAAEVLALLDESRTARERVMTEAQRYVAAGVDLDRDDPQSVPEVDHPGTGAPPGLWLVNDRGVYLRSNAVDRGPGSVAYARGYRGGVQLGDDEICEFIDAGPLEALRTGDTLVITLSESRVRLSLVRGA